MPTIHEAIAELERLRIELEKVAKAYAYACEPLEVQALNGKSSTLARAARVAADIVEATRIAELEDELERIKTNTLRSVR